MEFLGLSLPVLAAFVVLLLGLVLLARQLHALGVPRVMRASGADGASRERLGEAGRDAR